MFTFVYFYHIILQKKKEWYTKNIKKQLSKGNRKRVKLIYFLFHLPAMLVVNWFVLEVPWRRWRLICCLFIHICSWQLFWFLFIQKKEKASSFVKYNSYGIVYDEFHTWHGKIFLLYLLYILYDYQFIDIACFIKEFYG